MDGADYGYQGCNVQCRPLRPAKAEGEGNQSIGSKMRDPVHGAGKGMSGRGQAAEGEQAKREQRRHCAGESDVRGMAYCVQGMDG